MNHYRVTGRITGVTGVSGGSSFAPGEEDRFAGLLPAVQETAYLRARGLGRAVWGHLVPWHVATKIEPPDGKPAYLESFARASIRLPTPHPGFWLRHREQGGVRVGKVVALLNLPSWCDVVALVDDNAAGDAFLEHVEADGSDLPLSIGFKREPGGSVPYYGGELLEVQIVRALCTEVAVVDKAAYKDARLYSRGDLTALAAMAAAD